MTQHTKSEFEEHWQKFYWRDYIADERVALCSLEAQGLWTRMLGYMFLSEQRGFLYLAGEAMSKQKAGKSLAKLCGIDEAKCLQLLDELDHNGVYSTCDHGTIYNRRMVREAELSRIRAAAGAMGGKAKDESKTQAKDKQNASKSLAKGLANCGLIQNPESGIRNPESGSEKQEAKKPEELTTLRGEPRVETQRDIAFDRFWQVYPKKRDKGHAEKAWKALKPNDELVEKILGAVEAAKGSSDWQRDFGKYIPYPATWLRGKRWEDDLQKHPLDGVVSEKTRASIDSGQRWLERKERESRERPQEVPAGNDNVG